MVPGSAAQPSGWSLRDTGASLLPINSLRLTRLSTSVKDVELWSEVSVLASSRSVIHNDAIINAPEEKKHI